MKKKTLIIGVILIMGLATLFGGCGKSAKKTATLRITSHYKEDMIYIPEEEAGTPEPDPVEELEVKVGDQIKYLFTVKKITEGSITVKMEDPGMYYADIRDKDGTTVKHFEYEKEYTFGLGEKLCLVDVGILDATHTEYIEYVK